MRPLVSILYPCFNAEKYLSHSLESILRQDYSNLEIICINDGSTDGTLSLLEDYQTADTRINIVNNTANLGLIASLNNGIAFVKGEFFARMDADDYCPPDRIARQVKFITSHPEFDLVSSGYYYFIENGNRMEYVPPVGTLPCSLKFISLFSTPLTHASVLGRSGLLKNGQYRYDIKFPHSEDYELFSRLAWEGINLANLPEALYWVRLNPESVSVLYNEEQINSHLRITKRNIEQHFDANHDLSEPLLKVISNRINVPVTKSQLWTAVKFLRSCYRKIIKEDVCSPKEKSEVRHYMTLHIVNILIQSNKVGFKMNRTANLPFFFRSLFLFRPSFSKILATKIIVYLKHRSM